MWLEMVLYHKAKVCGSTMAWIEEDCCLWYHISTTVEAFLVCNFEYGLKRIFLCSTIGYGC